MSTFAEYADYRQFTEDLRILEEAETLLEGFWDATAEILVQFAKISAATAQTGWRVGKGLAQIGAGVTQAGIQGTRAIAKGADAAFAKALPGYEAGMGSGIPGEYSGQQWQGAKGLWASAGRGGSLVASGVRTLFNMGVDPEEAKAAAPLVLAIKNAPDDAAKTAKKFELRQKHPRIWNAILKLPKGE